MTGNSRKITVKIHRSEITRAKREGEEDRGMNLEGQGVPDNKLKLGQLFESVIVPLQYNPKTHEDEAIILTVERKHEWELLLVWWLKAAAGAFILGAIGQLGKRFADWALDTARTWGDNEGLELRAEGLAPVKIKPGDDDKIKEAVSKLFEEASEKNIDMELVAEPGRYV
jgi:hypothetical protein